MAVELPPTLLPSTPVPGVPAGVASHGLLHSGGCSTPPQTPQVRRGDSGGGGGENGWTTARMLGVVRLQAAAMLGLCSSPFLHPVAAERIHIIHASGAMERSGSTGGEFTKGGGRRGRGWGWSEACDGGRRENKSAIQRTAVSQRTALTFPITAHPNVNYSVKNSSA